MFKWLIYISRSRLVIQHNNSCKLEVLLHLIVLKKILIGSSQKDMLFNLNNTDYWQIYDFVA